MKRSYSRAKYLALVGLLCAAPTIAQAQPDPVFTYQGQLKEAGRPYNGVAYFEFSLWDAVESGTPIGDPYSTWSGVDVVDGLFTVEVDAMMFGPEAFTGAPRWLQIAVHDMHGLNRVVLTPRQPITPAPYALYAYDAPGGGSGDSLWSDSGGDIYYDGGNVGIGEQWPWASLTVIISLPSLADSK